MGSTGKGDSVMNIKIIPNNDEQVENVSKNKISNFRRSLPQFLACTAQNLILFDNGLVLAFPTIVIAALLNSKTDLLSLTEIEASWFASIAYICQPLGSLLSGLAMEPLGRKKSMLLLNIPKFTAWMLLYWAPDIASLYFAGAIMGLGVGFSEAPILTYVGEISVPKLRGRFASYAQLCGTLAYTLLYLTSWYLSSWRTTALVCGGVPMFTWLMVWLLAPESPSWLISKGRVSEAEQSMRKLRGWVSKTDDDVKNEIDDLIEYHKKLKEEEEAYTNTPQLKTKELNSTEVLIDNKKPNRILRKIKYMLAPEVRKAFFIICGYFFFYYASGLPCIRPYMVPVLQDMGIKLNPDAATVYVSALNFAGNAVCMAIVNFLGKRILTLTSLLGCAVCTCGLAFSTYHALSTYGFYLLMALSFFNGLGIAPIPWMLQCELFPFRCRGMAAGLAAAISYLIGFLATKTFLTMSSQITMEFVYLFYTIMSVIGVIILYKYLPETEGRTLEEIERELKGIKDEPEQSAKETTS